MLIENFAAILGQIIHNIEMNIQTLNSITFLPNVDEGTEFV